MKSTLSFLQKHFGTLLVIASILAFLLPNLFLWGDGYGDEFLMLALFLGALKIDFSELFHLKKNFRRMIFFVILNILILPVAFYLLSFGLDQDLRVGLFLLFAAPGAVATPLLASFLGLNILWSTVFVILTSLLAPFTIPFLSHLLIGAEVAIDFFSMFLFLAKMVFLPGILAIFLERFMPKVVRQINEHSGGIGSLTMALFVAIVIAVNQASLSEHLFEMSSVPVLLWLTGLFLFKFLLGFFISNTKEKWTNSLMFGNMNGGLIILLASEFFGPGVLLVVLLQEIPWILAQPVFQKMAAKYK